MLDQDANRAMFEEQVDIIFKAFNNERFSHQGVLHAAAEVPYRGYALEGLTVVPRPKHLPVVLAADRECQSAGTRLHGQARHQGRGRQRLGTAR